MNKPFKVYISRPDDISGDTGVSIALPATPFEISDALEQARVTNERDIYTVEMESCKLRYLTRLIPPSANIYELNHLAQRLTELAGDQFDCFEGMVKMETAENGSAPIPLERLINFTHSMEECHFVFRVYDDQALGRFYVDNDFPVIPPNLPEALYEMLDYESIGRKARVDEGGVFTHGGYVVQGGEIAEHYHSGDAVPKEKPNHTVLLEVCKGYFHAPEYDSGQTARLMLPTAGYQLAEAVTAVGAASTEECVFTAVDCIVPALTEHITDALEADFGSYGMVSELAEQLARLEQKGLLTTYKAMLAAAPEDIMLEEAHDLSCEVEGVILSRELASCSDYAKEQLRKCGVPLLDELCGMANLHKYGGRLMEENRVQYTPYGLLRSVDGRTMEEVLGRKSPEQGMEMK